jgi:cytochrome c
MLPKTRYQTGGAFISSFISILRLARAGITGCVGAVLCLGIQIGHAGELHHAAQIGDLGAMTALLEAGAFIDETDGENETALHKAAKGNHAAAVVLLLEAGADPYISGDSVFGPTGTPLHAAARLGRIEALKALLDAGIDPNLNDPGAGPPLHFAVLYRRSEAVELLKSYGASRLTASSIKDQIAVADPVDGAEVANACRICHLMQNTDDGMPRAGPTLWDIVGRPKASAAGFSYSEAMAATDGIWSYDDLNSYLANPKGFVPGTKMESVHGLPSAERRAALIRYLRDLSETRFALPD